MAEGLQILTIGEQFPIAPVRLDVVNVCCPNSQQMRQAFPFRSGCTLPAERFPQQVIRMEIVNPDGQAVPAMPLGGIRAPSLPVPGAMLVAVH